MNRSLLIWLGLVMILVGVVYLMFFSSNSERETSYSTGKVNVNIDSASVVKIDIQSKDKTITLENVGGKWLVTYPVRYPANVQQVTQLIGEASKFKIGSLVSSNPEKQSLFQVDTAAGLKLTVNDRNGKMTSMIIGKSGPSYYDVYVRVPNSNDVYIGEGINPWTLNRELKEWRDKAIYVTPSDSIRGLAYNVGERTVVLSRENARWYSGADTVANDVITPAVNSIANFHCDDFADSLTQQQPSVVVNVTAPEAVSLALYPQLPDSARYFVRASQSQQTFVVSKFTVQQILKPYEALKKSSGKSSK